MKRFVTALAFAAACVTAPAFADTIGNSVGNTIVITYPNEAQARFHFEADGTYSATLPDGNVINGAYAVADGQICLTPEGGEQGCTEYVGDKNVGDSWTQTATDGSTITVTLEAGR